MEEKDLIFNEKALPKKPKKGSKNNAFREKECEVIAYNERAKTLDVLFDGYGIRIMDVNEFVGDTVTVKYTGEIGKSNFRYKI